MKTFDLKKYGSVYKIRLNVTSYMEGTLECPDCQPGFRSPPELCIY